MPPDCVSRPSRWQCSIHSSDDVKINMDQIYSIDAIPEGESRGLQHGEHHLIAIKKDGQLHLYLNRCPHRGIPLEWLPDQFLDLDRAFIQCSTHGALFQIETGECIQGPCQGQSLTPIPFSIKDGTIYLKRPPNEG